MFDDQIIGGTATHGMSAAVREANRAYYHQGTHSQLWTHSQILRPSAPSASATIAVPVQYTSETQVPEWHPHDLGGHDLIQPGVETFVGLSVTIVGYLAAKPVVTFACNLRDELAVCRARKSTARFKL
jgi:hypothetical protein